MVSPTTASSARMSEPFRFVFAAWSMAEALLRRT
jgi:hypothetical protein